MYTLKSVPFGTVRAIINLPVTLFSRLTASLKEFARDLRAQADAAFWLSVGFSIAGRLDVTITGLAFASCLYLRHLCGKSSGGQAETE